MSKALTERLFSMIHDNLEKIDKYYAAFRRNADVSETTPAIRGLGYGIETLMQLCRETKPKKFKGSITELLAYDNLLEDYINSIEAADTKGQVLANSNGREKLHINAKKVLVDGLQDIVFKGRILGKGTLYKEEPAIKECIPYEKKESRFKRFYSTIQSKAAKLKKAARKVLTGAILLGASAFGCAYVDNMMTEDIQKIEEFQKIPEVKLKFKADPLLDSYSGADNTLSANRAVMKSSDSLLKKIHFDNTLGRLVKLFTVDTVSTYFFMDYQHEQFGHVYRAEEQGIHAVANMCLRHPFIKSKDPRPYATTEAVDKTNPKNNIKKVLVYMGGLESEVIRTDRLAENIMEQDKQSYYDAFAYMVEKAHLMLALGGEPRPNAVHVPMDEAGEWKTDDIFNLASMLHEYYGVKLSPNNIQGGGLWCALDSVFLISTLHTLAHLGEGVRQLPLPEFAFTTEYNIAPFGSEHHLNLFYRDDKGILTKIYGRKGMGNNRGTGAKFSNIPLETKISDRLNLGFDFWSQRFPERLKEYNGFGWGINAEIEKDIGKGAFLNVGLRAKTKGYNPGDSLDEDVSVYLGIGIKF